MMTSKISDVYQARKRTQHSPSVSTVTKTRVGQSGLQPSTATPTADPQAKVVDINKADLDLLREFDMNHEFGPSIGITRMERWQRAAKHDLNPPLAIKELIQNHSDLKAYTECVWTSYHI